MQFDLDPQKDSQLVLAAIGLTCSTLQYSVEVYVNSLPNGKKMDCVKLKTLADNKTYTETSLVRGTRDWDGLSLLSEVRTVKIYNKTRRGKEKLLITRNIFFSPNFFFNRIDKLNSVFTTSDIVVCKLIQFARVQNLSSDHG